MEGLFLDMSHIAEPADEAPISNQACRVDTDYLCESGALCAELKTV